MCLVIKHSWNNNNPLIFTFSSKQWSRYCDTCILKLSYIQVNDMVIKYFILNPTVTKIRFFIPLYVFSFSQHRNALSLYHSSMYPLFIVGQTRDLINSLKGKNIGPFIICLNMTMPWGYILANVMLMVKKPKEKNQLLRATRSQNNASKATTWNKLSKKKSTHLFGWNFRDPGRKQARSVI